MAAVGQGGLSTTGGCPVSQSFYECMVRNSQGARPLFSGDPSMVDFMQYKVQGMTRRKQQVHPHSRASFSLAFGISPRAQICIETYYDSLKLDFGLGENILMPFANCGW